ncbi:MAG: thrombospondin type 3 repeat-containing protein, partial [Bacteroidota bacterium]
EFEPFANKRFAADGTFKKILSPFLYGGIGYGIWTEPDVDFNGRTGPGITADQAEVDGGDGTVVFPGGGGLRWYLSPKTSLALDFSVRFTGSDYVDGVSEAANPNEDDVYAFAGLNLSVGFGKKDADKDGIVDEEDVCPDEPGPESTGGCPDTDGDGIADKDDVCPEEAGVASLAGCPDTDGDGISDKDDVCPTVAGLASLGGCPDGDGDGIADQDDDCPSTAGIARLNGCPDTDGDGIKDSDDECPTVAGIARFQGCPDSDGDGIKDSDDDCPTVAGVVARSGCPEPVEEFESLEDRIARYQPLVAGLEYITVSEETGTISIENLYFDTDLDLLRSLSNRVLDDVVTFLTRPGAENFTLRFEGHADERYTETYNQTLSEERAKSAMDYVIRKGVDASRLSMIGFGETKPLGESLQENRVVVNVANEPPRKIN